MVRFSDVDCSSVRDFRWRFCYGNSRLLAQMNESIALIVACGPLIFFSGLIVNAWLTERRAEKQRKQ